MLILPQKKEVSVVRKIVLMAVIITLVIGIGALSSFAAQKGQAAAQPQSEDRMVKAGKNLTLGWTEIPKTIQQVTKDTDNPFMGITVGLLKGVANAFSRTTSGAVDVVTFPTGQKESLIKEKMVPVEQEAAKSATK
jgi:putative exosortase-associated protein (TIGR04073 family)